MEWTKEAVLKFLDAYKAQRCIWDPRHSEHKNRSTGAVAWQKIHRKLNFDCTIDELKKKRNSLMASFRTLMNKKKKCIQADSEELFEPHWFAYEYMEQFLGPLYHLQSIKPEIATIDIVDDSETWEEETPNFKIEDLCSNDSYDGSGEMLDQMSSVSVMRLQNTTTVTENPIEEAVEVEVLKNTSKRKKSYVEEENDECDLYAQLLAKKLRRFSEYQREEIMLEIDALLIKKRKSLLDQTLNISTSTPSVGHFGSSCSTSSHQFT